MLRCSKTARPAAVRRTGVDTGTECGAILQQIAAVRGAVNGLMVEVLEGHLRGHLAPLQSGDDGDLDDVIAVLRSYLK
jgi:DNA-binding FrmR family transcriptional regulator